MPRYLVTGGAGFIGSHLTDELLRRGHEAIVLDDLSGGSRDRVPPAATFVHGSITDEKLVDDLFDDQRPDGVFHLAAFTAEAISHAVKRHNYLVNVMGSVNLINAAIRTRVGFFGFASSVGVYGHAATPMRESEPVRPADSYGLAKLAVERELAVTMNDFDLPFTAFRMHNVFGEWQNMRDPYRNAVTIFMNQILRGEPIGVYGDGTQVRAFTYVRDIVPVIADAAGHRPAWGRVFNLGAARPYSLLELVDRLTRAMDVPDHPVVHLPARREVHAAFTDTALAREVFGGWRDTPLEEALAATAAWAGGHGSVDLQPSFELELSGEHVPEWVRSVQERLARPALVRSTVDGARG